MVLVGLLAFFLGVVVLAHVSLIAGLLRRSAWRAPLALVIPPLAPYWGAQRGMVKRGILWCAGVVGYALVLMLRSVLR